MKSSHCSSLACSSTEQIIPNVHCRWVLKKHPPGRWLSSIGYWRSIHWCTIVRFTEKSYLVLHKNKLTSIFFFTAVFTLQLGTEVFTRVGWVLKSLATFSSSARKHPPSSCRWLLNSSDSAVERVLKKDFHLTSCGYWRGLFAAGGHTDFLTATCCARGGYRPPVYRVALAKLESGGYRMDFVRVTRLLFFVSIAFSSSFWECIVYGWPALKLRLHIAGWHPQS